MITHLAEPLISGQLKLFPEVGGSGHCTNVPLICQFQALGVGGKWESVSSMCMGNFLI